jgi:hypothetical protein
VSVRVFPATRFLATKLQISDFSAVDRTKPESFTGVRNPI